MMVMRASVDVQAVPILPVREIFSIAEEELLLYSTERKRDHLAAVKEAMEKLYEENGRQERIQAYAETGLEMYLEIIGSGVHGSLL